MLAVSVLVVACGGSSPDRSAATKEQATEQKAEAKFADFARCLREHGVDVELVSHPGGGHGVKLSRGNDDPEAAMGAQKACARFRPPPQKASVSPQQKVEQEERGQRFAKCVREHGIKLEVRTSGNSARMLVGGREPAPDSPAFQRAMSACGGPKG